MKMKRVLSVVLTILMVFMLMPAMVFAEGKTALGGTLEIRGIHSVGEELSADSEKVTPWISDADVTYAWYRINEDNLQWLKADASAAGHISLNSLSTQKTYTVREEDLGYHLILVITGKAENGLTGALAAVTKAVVAAEEAEALKEQGEKAVDTGCSSAVTALEDFFAPEEELPEEVPEETQEELPEEAAEETEAAAEDIIYEEPVQTPEELPADTVESEEESLFEITESEEYNSEEQVQPEAEPVYTVEIKIDNDAENLDFGTIKNVDDAEYIYYTVKNTGNVPMDFPEISPEHFMVQDIMKTLNPGETAELWAIPRKTLQPGTYEDVITYTSKDGFKFDITAKVVLEEPEKEESAAEPEPTETPEPTKEPEPTEEPIVTPDPTEAPEPTEVPAVFDVKGVEPEGLTFDPVMAGYTSVPAEIRVAYTCSETMNALVTITADNGFYVISDVPAEPLPAAEKGYFTFKVALKEGLPGGTYQDTLKLHVNGEKRENLLNVSATVNEPVSSLSVEPAIVDLGVMTEGESALATATIKNTGNQDLTLVNPVATYFVIRGADGVKLAPGESVSIQVEPVKGLAAGEYEQQIDVFVATEGGNVSKAKMTMKVNVAKKAEVIKVIDIVNPAAITGLVNGTAKDPESLKLPATVLINTNKGQVTTSVTWDVSKAPYDPTLASAQTFSVTGQVALPKGVSNPDNVTMLTTVQISVDAHIAKLADPSENKINGITGGYNTTSKITFSAVGAGMDNDAPKAGDTRYLPENWSVVNTYSWEKAPYTAAFGMAKAGDYTLSVSFKQQKFDGSAWADTGEKDVKKVAFQVAQSQVTPTAVPGQSLTPAAHKNVVNTGDSTPIALMIGILVAAAAVIAGVIGYKVIKK